MKILAIDTTTKFLCLGLYDNAKIYEYNLELGRKHSSLLCVAIKRVLEALDWQIKEIDYFGCGIGPGSFTGVRIGLATLKSLAWVFNKPILGISTLDIVAENTKFHTASYIMPAIDAKRNLIYCSVFKNKNGHLKRIKPYLLLTEKEFMRKAKPQSLIFGDAVGLYKDAILSNIKGALILDKDYWYPQARNIIALCLERIKHKKFDSPFDIQPIYLYPKECQIKTHEKK